VREYQTTAREIQLQRKEERKLERHQAHMIRPELTMSPRQLARERSKANRRKGKSGHVNQQRMNAINGVLMQQQQQQKGKGQGRQQNGGVSKQSAKRTAARQKGRQKKLVTNSKPQGPVQAPVFKVLQRDFPSL
jgi:hypothetical protein